LPHHSSRLTALLIVMTSRTTMQAKEHGGWTQQEDTKQQN
jgi:hypothetical protein